MTQFDHERVTKNSDYLVDKLLADFARLRLDIEAWITDVDRIAEQCKRTREPAFKEKLKSVRFGRVPGGGRD